MPPKTEISEEKEKALKTVAKAGGFMFFGLIISRFLGYLTRISLARFLGPGGMGIVYLAASISGIVVTISLFGLPTAISRYVSHFKGKDELGKVKGVITSSLKISFPISLFFSIFLFLLSNWVATTIFHKPVLSIALKIFAVSIPFRVLLNVFAPSIKAFQKVKYFIISKKIIEPLSKFILVLLFLLLGLGIAAGSLGYTLGFVTAASIAFYFLEKKVFPILKTKVKSISLKRKLLSFSWPLLLAGVLWTFVGKVDTLMIGWLIKEAEPLGIYQAALPTSQFLNLIPMTLSFLFLPIISDLLSRDKEEEIRDLYKTTAKWIFYVNLPILFILLIFPKAVLNVLFGGDFITGATVLSVLSVGFFITSFGNLGGRMINLLERTKFHLVNSVTALTVDIILNYLLIPIYGILGAGIATTTTFILYGSLQILEAWHLTGSFPISPNFVKSLLAALISGSLLFYLTNVWFPSSGLPFLIVAFFLFISLYSLLLLIFRGLESEDILILKSLERKTGLEVKFLRDLIRKFT